MCPFFPFTTYYTVLMLLTIQTFILQTILRGVEWKREGDCQIYAILLKISSHHMHPRSNILYTHWNLSTNMFSWKELFFASNFHLKSFFLRLAVACPTYKAARGSPTNLQVCKLCVPHITVECCCMQPSWLVHKNDLASGLACATMGCWRNNRQRTTFKGLL